MIQKSTFSIEYEGVTCLTIMGISQISHPFIYRCYIDKYASKSIIEINERNGNSAGPSVWIVFAGLKIADKWFSCCFYLPEIIFIRDTDIGISFRLNDS